MPNIYTVHSNQGIRIGDSTVSTAGIAKRCHIVTAPNLTVLIATYSPGIKKIQKKHLFSVSS